MSMSRLYVLAALSLTCATGCITSPFGGGQEPDPEPPEMIEPELTSAHLRGVTNLVTFDGRHVGFHAVGEFVLAEALAGAPLMVQVRQRELESTRCEGLAVVDAVAARVGSQRVVFELERGVFVDGQPISLEQPDTFALEQGNLARGDDGSWALEWPDATTLEVTFATGRLDLTLGVPESRGGFLGGLLGTFDGNPANDLVTRAGEAQTEPISWNDFYRVWADSWRVTQDEALFEYLPLETTDDYTNRALPLQPAYSSGVADSEVSDARQQCQEAGVSGDVLTQACAFDLVCAREQDLAGALAGVESPRPFEVSPPGYLSACTSTFETCAREGCEVRADEIALDQSSPADGPLTYDCPPGCDFRDDWGSAGVDIYTDDSSICTSAIHAGAIDTNGGRVTFWMAPAQLTYPGSTRNGVTTEEWDEYWERSFVFSPEFDCTDGVDNDRNGLIDCEDATCAEDEACAGQ